MAAWREYCPVSGAAKSRAERLAWMALKIGRPVSSANDCSDAELVFCIKEIARGDRAGTPSDAQLWKIRQLEKWLGWADNRARLAGLLRKLFRVEYPTALSRQQCWRAIEALMNIGARKAGKSKTEIREELKTWRPTETLDGVPF
jgi:hypothetical protein